MKQAKVLYIFVTSDAPDVYINTIGYCLEHYDTNRVVFLGIVKDKGQRVGTEKYLKEVKDRVLRQLSLLQEGKYLYKNQETKEWRERDIEIQPHDRVRYAKIAEREIEPYTIVYSVLENEITGFLNSNNYNCIFDVSAILKGYLVDVYVLLLSRKVEDIYAFELKLRGRTYDEKELIHNLSLDNGDYEFVNLTRSDYTREKIIKTKQEEEILVSKVRTLDKTLENLASDFANTMLIIYTLIVIVSFIGVVVIVTRTDWSSIEPLTFVLFGTPFLSYVVSLLIQLIFRKELSLRPKNIFDWLKRYKLKKLSKEFGSVV